MPSNILKNIALLLLVLSAFGCVIAPDAEPIVPPQPSPSGIFVLCEGNWRADNSSLTFINPTTGEVVRDFFSASNPGLRLGDTGNDLMVLGDTTYILVSTSRTIEIMETTTGTSLGRWRHSGGELRHFAIDTTSRMFWVSSFEGGVLRLLKESGDFSPLIPTGAFPEEVAIADGKVFIANSGLGDVHATRPGSGTMLALDKAGDTLYRVENLPNIQRIIVRNSTNTLLLPVPDLPSRADSLAFIAEIDPSDGSLCRRIDLRMRPSSSLLTPGGDTLLFIANNSVHLLDLRHENPAPQKLFDLPNPPVAGISAWRGMTIAPSQNSLWLCNSKTFTGAGEVVEFTFEGNPLRAFTTGINPKKIVFF